MNKNERAKYRLWDWIVGIVMEMLQLKKLGECRAYGKIYERIMNIKSLKLSTPIYKLLNKLIVDFKGPASPPPSISSTI